ncbi:hypothetical protein AWP66_13550 [Escherichia coli]|nr:hypothetical protein [Salmonella enterica subsp. enterica serovar Baildon]OKV84315.1 hypothetical protein AWP66_13550 [Escherichia coli]
MFKDVVYIEINTTDTIIRKIANGFFINKTAFLFRSLILFRRISTNFCELLEVVFIMLNHP